MSGESAQRQSRSDRIMMPLVATCVLLTVLSPCLLSAQQDERSVRAAFIFNASKYVIWPESSRDLNICVLGGGSISSALKLVVEGKSAGPRAIHILEPPDTEFRRCDILYWSGTARLKEQSILDKTRGCPILTIGEDDGFVREGGMMAFVRSGDSIQIEVNIDSVKAGGLKISSRLMDLAVIVHSRRQG